MADLSAYRLSQFPMYFRFRQINKKKKEGKADPEAEADFIEALRGRSDAEVRSRQEPRGGEAGGSIRSVRRSGGDRL